LATADGMCTTTTVMHQRSLILW